MGQRFSRIRQAQKLEAALTKYDQWLVAPKPTKTGSPKNRPASDDGYIVPFNIAIGATELVKASYLTGTEATEIIGVAGARFRDTLPNGTTELILRRFKPARIKVVTQTSTQGTYATSKITGGQYIKYAQTSASVPFGRSSAATAEAEGTAFTTLKGNAAFTGKKVYLIAEKFSV